MKNSLVELFLDIISNESITQQSTYFNKFIFNYIMYTQ